MLKVQTSLLWKQIKDKKKKTTCLRVYLTYKKRARVKNKGNIVNLKSLKKPRDKVIRRIE